MPPVANKLAERDRLEISRWVEDELRRTACSLGRAGGRGDDRRLNRGSIGIRSAILFGLDYNVEDIFPADDSGGEGFDNNGETLFMPPLLMEALRGSRATDFGPIGDHSFAEQAACAHELKPGVVAKEKALPMGPGEEISAEFNTFQEGDYEVRFSIHYPKDREKDVFVRVDGREVGRNYLSARSDGWADVWRSHDAVGAGQALGTSRVGDYPVEFYSIRLEHKQAEPSFEKRALPLSG